MKYLIIPILALFSYCAGAQDSKKQITLEDIYKNNTFRVKDVPGFNALKSGEEYTQLDTEDSTKRIIVYNLASGKKLTTIFDNSEIKFDGKKISFDSYEFSENENKIMLFTDAENIYRRSVLHYVYVYDRATKKVQKVDTGKILHASFSPDGTQVAFVKSNNLFIKNLSTGELTQVTRDGEKNKIINGNCDWVYEEEFSFTKAFEWNKNSKYIAYYRFDESQVPEYTMPIYKGLYPENNTFKYPKAGEKNSIIQIKIFDVAHKTNVNAELGSNTDIYIPRIKWTEESGKLCILRLNRLQNKLDYMFASAKTGSTRTFYTEKNKYFIDINDAFTFVKDGKSMIFLSDQDGHTHLYRYNFVDRNILCLTPGDFDVDGVTSVDAENKLVYYTAAVRSAMQRNLYCVTFSGYGHDCITPEKGMHSITPCKGNNYFLDKYSTLNSVPVYRLRDSKGKIIRTLEKNETLKEKMKEYALGGIEFIKIKGVEEQLNGYMITPPSFDRTKKYPVLMFQYSGPGSQQVLDLFPVGNYWWHQLLAEKGYIIVCVDGTGTGARGEEFRKKTYLQLGKFESDDQIAVAKNLAKLPYVDGSRIGIWGWSYGGFMSSTCIMKGADIFKTAIAVAPVTNWRYYDNIYTERYMRTPQENAKGYDGNSPEFMADKLKGKFLFIHGTADDNVHFQNSAMLATALIKANKDYDSEYYPDKNHGIYGGNTRLHLYRRMTNYILDNL